MIRHAVHADAPAAEAWSLLARPGRWHEWAPHIRGADGLGSPEVESGRRGRVRLLGAPVGPAEVLEVVDGHSWRWRVGPVSLNHEVQVEGDGCRVSVSLEGPRVVEAALRPTYGPVMALAVRNLARVAARAPRPRPGAASR